MIIINKISDPLVTFYCPFGKYLIIIVEFTKVNVSPLGLRTEFIW